jgi:hypothetical protein
MNYSPRCLHGLGRLLALMLVGVLLLGSMTALAAPTLAHTSHALVTTKASIQLSAPRAAAHLSEATSPATSCDADPVACANTLTQPFGGLYQTAVMVLLIFLSSVFGAGALWVLVKGAVSFLMGEPRTVSHMVGAFIGLVFMLVLGFKSPGIATSLVGGQHIVPPPIFQATGG